METTVSPRYLLIQCMQYVIKKQKIKRIMTNYDIWWSASENDGNSNPYDINLHKHGNYSFTKIPNDKVYGVGKSRHKHEMNRLTPTTVIQQKENETSFNSMHTKGEKEEEVCGMNDDDDEKLQKFKGLHNREQDQMD